MQLLICAFLLVSLLQPATRVNCSLPLVTSQGLLNADSAASFDSRRRSVRSEQCTIRNALDVLSEA
jgi:hypothetical protein